MSTLVFYPDGGRGGPEFAREAAKFCDWARLATSAQKVTRLEFGWRAPVEKRCQAIVESVRATQPDIVVFFCHGLTQRIQPGFERGPQFRALARALAHTGLVVLYCCSTAGGPGVNGEGGFADRLRDAANVDVMGHVGPGHTSRRPYIRWFDTERESDNAGGGWLVPPPGTPGYVPAQWAKLRRALRTDFRFELSNFLLLADAQAAFEALDV